MIQRPLAVSFLFRQFCILIVGAAIATSWSSISAQSSLPDLDLPGDLAPALAAGNQQRPQIARGSNGFLAVWADTRTVLINSPGYAGIGPKAFSGNQSPGQGTQSDIFAARLDANGNVIDTIPIAINQAQFNQDYPVVAWNGQNWLVAWVSDHINGFSINYDIVAARVSPSGVVLDDPPLVLSLGQTSDFVFPSVVTSDGTNWVVGWSSFLTGTSDRPLYGARISPSGSVLDPGGKILVNPGHQFVGYPDLAFAGDEYLMVWAELLNGNKARGQRLSLALDPIGAPFDINLFSPSDARGPGVASNGNDFLVVWNDQRFAYDQLLGSRVSHAGQVLDPAGIEVSGHLFNGNTNFDLCWDGANYFVDYNKTNNLTQDDVLVTRVSPAGAVLDPQGILVKAAPDTPVLLAIAPRSGGGAQVAWSGYWFGFQTSGSEAQDIRTAVVSAGGAVNLDTAVSLGAPRQSKPRMALGGSGSMVVFRSEISGDARILAQRLDPEGAPLDQEPILIANGSPNLTVPSVAWNGSLFLVTWEDTSANSGRGQVYGRRMTPAGTVLDPSPIPVMIGLMSDVAALGDTFLVVATDVPTNPEIRSVFWARVSSSGAVLDQPALGGSSGGFVRWPRVAALGGRWLIVSEGHPTHDQPRSNIGGRFINPDGTLASGFAVSSGVSPQQYSAQPHLASAGDQALIVWSDKAQTDIYGRRILADGTLLDSPDGFVISNAPENQFFPAVAWDGLEYLVCWIDHRNDPFPLQPRGDIYGARVDSNGNVLDPNGLTIAASPLPEETPTVVGSNGTGLFAYGGFYERAPYASFRITLRRFPFDARYAISANPSSQVVAPGATTSFNVQVTPIGGFTGTVSFSLQGLPAGSTSSFNPPSITGGGSSTLSVTTSDRTPEGLYSLTIVASSGAQQSTAQIALNVTNSPPTSSYGVTDIPTLGGSTIEARAVNDAGQVAGFSSLSPGSTTPHAFLYSGGHIQDLGTLGGAESRAYDINTSGQIVGYSQPGPTFFPRRAFRYSGGVMQDIGTLGGEESYAFGISDSGMIVGASQLSGGSGPHAFLYNAGTFTDLGTFGGLTSQANDINNAGQVVGEASISNGNIHAFLYNGGAKQDLGTLGGADSYAYGINDSGQIVGGAANDPGFTRFHAFLYSGGSMQDLGTLGGLESIAHHINNAGKIVGYAAIASGEHRAFLYDGTMNNLNTLIPAGTGWVLIEAFGINETGQITGNGTVNGQPHLFLLTPSSGSTGCSYSISPTVQNFTAAGGEGAVHVSLPAGCALPLMVWTATSNASWITINAGSSGAGNGVVTYLVQPGGGSPRAATISIAGQTFTVMQTGGASCTYSISPISKSFTSRGGEGGVNVTAPSGCSWTATSNATWLGITSAASGSGDDVVTYALRENFDTSPRTGTIIIAGQTFTVTQYGINNCKFSISPTSTSFAKNGGTGTVNVAVSSGCGWTATSNASWVTVTSGGSSMGSGVVTYSVTVNNSNLARVGTMLIAGKTFTVKQKPR